MWMPSSSWRRCHEREEVPASGQRVSVDGNVAGRFSEAMDNATTKAHNIHAKKEGSTASVAASVSYSRATNTATLNPKADLKAATTCTATI